MAFIGPSPRPHIDVTTSGKRALSSSVVVTTILCRDARASNIGTGTSCLNTLSIQKLIAILCLYRSVSLSSSTSLELSKLTLESKVSPTEFGRLPPTASDLRPLAVEAVLPVTIILSNAMIGSSALATRFAIPLTGIYIFSRVRVTAVPSTILLL